ncbi:hypothetical protein HK102_014185 [Quaeritorhiza haematococci]|nr:hypothetical protein HK102_014185 [Quaeritorhiza haematococci]
MADASQQSLGASQPDAEPYKPVEPTPPPNNEHTNPIPPISDPSTASKTLAPPVETVPSNPLIAAEPLVDEEWQMIDQVLKSSTPHGNDQQPGRSVQKSLRMSLLNPLDVQSLRVKLDELLVEKVVGKDNIEGGNQSGSEAVVDGSDVLTVAAAAEDEVDKEDEGVKQEESTMETIPEEAGGAVEENESEKIEEQSVQEGEDAASSSNGKFRPMSWPNLTFMPKRSSWQKRSSVIASVVMEPVIKPHSEDGIKENDAVEADQVAQEEGTGDGDEEKSAPTQVDVVGSDAEVEKRLSSAEKVSTAVQSEDSPQELSTQTESEQTVATAEPTASTAISVEAKPKQTEDAQIETGTSAEMEVQTEAQTETQTEVDDGTLKIDTTPATNNTRVVSTSTSPLLIQKPIMKDASTSTSPLDPPLPSLQQPPPQQPKHHQSTEVQTAHIPRKINTSVATNTSSGGNDSEPSGVRSPTGSAAVILDNLLAELDVAIKELKDKEPAPADHDTSDDGRKRADSIKSNQTRHTKERSRSQSSTRSSTLPRTSLDHSTASRQPPRRGGSPSARRTRSSPTRYRDNDGDERISESRASSTKGTSSRRRTSPAKASTKTFQSQQSGTKRYSFASSSGHQPDHASFDEQEMHISTSTENLETDEDVDLDLDIPLDYPSDGDSSFGTRTAVGDGPSSSLVSPKALKMMGLSDQHELKKSPWNAPKAIKVMGLTSSDLERVTAGKLSVVPPAGVVDTGAEIEVAGPTIDMLTTQGYLYCGFLQKPTLSKIFLKTWKTKFFVLTTGMLYYYKSNDPYEHPVGEIPITHDTITSMMGPGGKHILEIRSQVPGTAPSSNSSPFRRSNKDDTTSTTSKNSNSKKGGELVERVWQLQCEDENDMRAWLRMLKKAVPGRDIDRLVSVAATVGSVGTDSHTSSVIDDDEVKSPGRSSRKSSYDATSSRYYAPESLPTISPTSPYDRKSMRGPSFDRSEPQTPGSDHRYPSFDHPRAMSKMSDHRPPRKSADSSRPDIASLERGNSGSSLSDIPPLPNFQTLPLPKTRTPKHWNSISSKSSTSTPASSPPPTPPPKTPPSPSMIPGMGGMSVPHSLFTPPMSPTSPTSPPAGAGTGPISIPGGGMNPNMYRQLISTSPPPLRTTSRSGLANNSYFSNMSPPPPTSPPPLGLGLNGYPVAAPHAPLPPIPTSPGSNVHPNHPANNINTTSSSSYLGQPPTSPPLSPRMPVPPPPPTLPEIDKRMSTMSSLLDYPMRHRSVGKPLDGVLAVLDEIEKSHKS